MKKEQIEEILAPVSVQELESQSARVEAGLWKKLAAYAGKLPFAEDILAAYYCATDPKTPAKVKGTLIAALAYFILPTDFIPDFLLTVGFTDDIAVLTTAIAMVKGHITDDHLNRAKEALSDPEEIRENVS